MEKLVRRVTVVQRGAGAPEAVTVYKRPKEEGGKKKDSLWARPLERIARRLVKAEIIFAQDLLRRHDESKRRGRNGWLADAPENFKEARRKALNEVRKSVPFRLLPKA